MTRDARDLLLPSILLLVALGTIVSGVLTPRDLSVGEDEAILTTSGDLAVFNVSRTLTLVVLFVSAAAITTTVIRRGFPRAGLSVWIAYVIFVLSNFLLPGIVGKVPGIDVRLLLPPLAFTAIYFARPMPAERLVTLCKIVLCGFVYASLVAAAFIPAQALAADYGSLIPGLNVRLYGVGGGATSLGPQAAAYLAIEKVSPSRSRLRVIHLLAATSVLLLAQSKTAWSFVLLGALYLLHLRVLRWLNTPLTESGRATRRWKTFFVTGLGLVCALLVFRLLTGSVGSAVLQNQSSLETLTGRTYVWTTTLRVWLDSPIFGYGNGLWESEGFRAEHGLYAHSHNEFVQSLGGAGLVGLLGLLVYLRAAWRAAIRQVRTNANAVPLVVLLLLLTLSLTEVHLRPHYLLDAFALLHMLLFALLMQGEKLEETRAAAPTLEAMPIG